MGSSHSSTSVKVPTFTVADNKVCGAYTFKGDDPWGQDGRYQYYIAYSDSTSSNFDVKNVTSENSIDNHLVTENNPFSIEGSDLSTLIGSEYDSETMYAFGIVSRKEITLFALNEGPVFMETQVPSADWVVSFGSGTSATDIGDVTKLAKC